MAASCSRRYLGFTPLGAAVQQLHVFVSNWHSRSASPVSSTPPRFLARAPTNPNRLLPATLLAR
jgi:hypothetical protein